MLSVVLRYTGKGVRVGCWLTTRVICPSHELNDDDSLSGYKIKSCPLSAEYCECYAHNVVAKYGVCLRFRIIEESGSGVNRDQSEVSTIHSPSLASYNSFIV